MPVAFDCECGARWWSPPSVCCEHCGPEAAATPDPVVWTVSDVFGTPVSISGQMRDPERFRSLVAAGFERFVDIAGAGHFVWRPDEAAVRRSGVEYVRVDGVEDTNVDLPDFAFDEVAAATDTDRRTLVFCASGLKRSPHLVYGALRRTGLDERDAWTAVVEARPFVDRWEPYVAAAERWLAARS